MAEFKCQLKSILEKSKVVAPRENDTLASVAMILRPKPGVKCEDVINFQDCSMFFILRAIHENDRWSGHVAFPGGKQEPNETAYEACRREVHEEIGIDVEAYFDCLGAINDRIVKLENRFIVRCFVFMQKSNISEIKFNPSKYELQACGWCNIDDLCNRDNLNLREVDITLWLQATEGPIMKLGRTLLKFNKIIFSEIRLPIKEIQLAEDDCDEEVVLDRFRLWGLTLGLIHELLSVQTKYLRRPLYATDSVDFFLLRFNIIRNVPNSFLKNALYTFSTNVGRRILGRRLMIQEQLQAVYVVFGFLSVIISVLVHRFAKL